MSDEQQETREPPNKIKRTEVKLTDSQVEVLISEVQARECLWNDLHDNFKNTTVTRKLWDEVGAGLDISGQEAKKKWKNLKDKYRKVIQKPPPKSGSAAVQQPKKWRFMDLMQFTKDSMMPGQTFGNLSTSASKSIETDITILEDTPNMDSDEDEHSINPPDIPIGDSTLKETSKKRYLGARPHRSKLNISSKNELEKEMVQIERKKLNAILDIQKNSKKEEDGDDYHFFMSLLPYMKKLDPLLKLELRGKIQSEVILAYRESQQMTAPQYSNFDYNPTQINPQSRSNMASPSIASSSSSNYQGPQIVHEDYDTNTFTILDLKNPIVFDEVSHS